MVELNRLFDLSGRTAIVTGGAGLLGAEFCRTLAEAGAQVVIADINREAAESIAASINSNEAKTEIDKDRGRAIPVEVDVTSRDSVSAMIDQALKTFDGLDILVNSAALDPKFDPELTRDGSFSFAFEEYPLDLWNQALAVNLTGMFLSCQAAARPMLQRGKGVIINICSIYGLVGPDQRIYQNPGKPTQFKPVHYSVTKAGVIGLTRYLAAYYAGQNIRVNALTPGGVYDSQDDAFVEAYSARTLLGRMAKKDELNGALLFLASDASAYMTGANLIVDGGWTAW